MSGRLSVEMSMMRKSAERETVQDVMEKTLLLCLYYDTKLTSTAETDMDKTCLLPDRIIITVNAERFRCVEVCSSVFPQKEASGSTTLLSRT